LRVTFGTGLSTIPNPERKKDLFMRILQLVAFLLSLPAASFANCYVLQNNTDSVQTWHFQYSHPLPGGKTILRLAAHSQFPANRAWCWDTAADYYAVATVDPGTYATSWQGTLIIGNGGTAFPSGTYSLQPQRTSNTAYLQVALKGRVLLLEKELREPTEIGYWFVALPNQNAASLFGVGREYL
jgi:hypothetical protein